MDNETKVEKRALVLGGGGARGSYQVGAYYALCELGYDFDIITGTSVGSLNGAMFTCDNFDMKTAFKLWSNISTDMVLDVDIRNEAITSNPAEAVVGIIDKAIKSGSIDQAPLRSLIEETLDIESFYSSKRDFGLVTVKFPSLKHVYITKSEIPKDKLVDYLLASSAVFPAMKTVLIDDVQHIDGGFYDNVPITLAKEMGATEVIAVTLNSIGRQLEDPKGIKITKIVPKDDLGFLLLFNPDSSKVNMTRGYIDTMKTFGKLKGYRYAFYPETFDPYKRKFLKLVAKACGKFKSNNAAENFISETTINLLKLRLSGSKAFSQGWIYAAAEVAGEVFGISPLNCYTREEFDSVLLEKLDEVKEITPLTNPDISDAIKTVLNERYVTKYLVGKLVLSLRCKNEFSAINLSSGLNLTPVIAALYIIFAQLARDSETKKKELST